MHWSKRALQLSLLISLFVVAGSFFAAPRPQESKPDYRNPSLPVEQRVKDLLGRMTLEEKVAQTEALWKRKELIMDDQGNFSPQKAASVLANGMGEITRASEKKGPRENALFTNAIQKYLIEHTRLGIPAIVHEESLHGFVAPGATSFPQAIALASTWDPKLVEKVFGVAAEEIRSRGGQQALTPVLGIAREPRWGRTEETYGEDPYLVSRMGVACVRGLQGPGPGPTIDQHHVIATVKHFAVHSEPEGGRNIAPGNYSMRTIREDFFPSFKAALTEAGAMSVMPSYNEIDGVPSHANQWLLQTVLRQEWGFKGIVVSDYFAIAQLETIHHVVASKEDAARAALDAGVDIELPDVDAYGTLAEQVRDGRISEATLDQTVGYILRAKFLLGLFEHPYVDADAAPEINNSPAHRELARQVAREALILLKNENQLLPLDPSKLKSIAVIGPDAAVCHLGGYSDNPGRTVSVLEGIKERVGNSIKVNYAEGCKITMNDTTAGWNEDNVELPTAASDEREIVEAVRVAKESDVALLVVGGNEQTSREAWADNHLGDRDSLQLVGRQNDLVKAVLATGKPAIVLLINGRPLAANYIAEHVPAVLEGWYLGEETGNAVADVVFGDFDPAGRLPITVPRSVGQLPDYYDHKPSAERPYLFATPGPLYPFGYGLSYTTFKYSEPRLAPATIGTAGETRVSVDVTNTGSREGDEVVQMYLRDEVSSVTRPVKELKGFERIHLKPGETKTVGFTLGFGALSFLNLNMHRMVGPGVFDVMVGPNSVDLKTVKLNVVER
jgi:beta-glucosidase-like glycosyl hydrolase